MDAAESENYSLESVSHLGSIDILVVKFRELDHLHIIDNVSLSVRAVKHCSLEIKKDAWKHLEVSSEKVTLPAIHVEINAQQLYDLIYKRKAGITSRKDKLI